LYSKIAKTLTFGKSKFKSEINERQAQILKTITEKPKTIFTAKELSNIFSVLSKTTLKDLQDLVALGLMQEININQRQMGYIRSDSFEVKLELLRRNHKE
jgi:predicted HTH transcriptional regulator